MTEDVLVSSITSRAPGLYWGFGDRAKVIEPHDVISPTTNRRIADKKREPRVTGTQAIFLLIFQKNCSVGDGGGGGGLQRGVHL